MSKFLSILSVIISSLLIAAGIANAQQLTVDINRISDTGVGDKIGTVIVSEGKGGVSLRLR